MWLLFYNDGREQDTSSISMSILINTLVDTQYMILGNKLIIAKDI